MKLTDLHPTWTSCGGDGVTNSITGEPVPLRERVGITLDCPKCGEGHLMMIPFANPSDGGPPVYAKGWMMTGDSFENLTLTPSILRMGGCGWHGFITNGEIITV